MTNKIIIVAVILLISAEQTVIGAKRPVYPGDDGKLVYVPDKKGNTIPDFSLCGYMKGGVSIPTVPVREVLSPTKDDSDDTARIQAAIDKVSALELDSSGFRGAVLLNKGLYRVSGTLCIRKSGVVLRGEGQQEKNGTIILGTGTKSRDLIRTGAGEVSKVRRGNHYKITDDYVPWGVKSFSLESTTGLSVGDPVMIYRPATKEWIQEIGMDQIPDRIKRGRRIPCTQWTPSGYRLLWERTITEISGNRITLDGPVVQAIDSEYGGGSIYRYTAKGEIYQVGIEHLRLDSEYNGKFDEKHAKVAIAFGGVVNGWVRNMTAVHLPDAVHIGSTSKFVTVQDCAGLEPISRDMGKRRYSFFPRGSFCLVQRCYAEEGRHTFVVGARDVGPNVFLDSLAVNSIDDSGPHHRWSTGYLYDNLKGGKMDARNRGAQGTGQGWAGAQHIFWNCEASEMTIQDPPTAKNYAIGCTGKRKGTKGSFVSHGSHVKPRSLYLKQLEDRLGKKAVLNVTTEAQRKKSSKAIYRELKKNLSK